MSYADDVTAKELEDLEKRIAGEYQKAYIEARRTWRNYVDGWDEVKDGKPIHHKSLQERYNEEFEAYKRGDYTLEQFNAWYRTQIERGKGYEKMVKEIAQRTTKTNQIASSYINGTASSVYALNANYTAYQISQEYDGIDFHLVNEEAIKILINNEQNVTEFRTTKINPVRDYEWNTEQIKSAMVSGILQGKSVDHMADAFLTVMQRNRASAIRNARTSITSAQNAGRMNTAQQAQAKGIDLKKKWHSMEDASVRFSHALLNGQIRDLDKTFSNGLMYPADSNGAPAEVYNCRCRSEMVLPKYENAISNERWEELSPEERAEEAKRYKEWQKENTGKAITKGFDFKDAKKDQETNPTYVFVEAKTIKEAESFAHDTIGVPTVNYKGLDLETANEMNRSLTDFANYSPEALERIKAYGCGQEINKIAKKAVVETLIEELKAYKPNMSDEWYQKNAEANAQRLFSKISGRTLAYARKAIDPATMPSFPKTCATYNNYVGVCVNKEFGKDSEDFVATLVMNMALKFHPEGSATIRSVFDHEFGHILDYEYGLRENTAIKTLYSAKPKSKIKDELSEYGASSIAEFIAEAYCEYLNNPQPRAIARIVGAEIEKAKNGDE